MKKFLAITLVIAVASIAASARGTRGGDEKTTATARAAELMEQARASIGGAKLKAVEGLAASGKSRQVIQTQDGENQMEGEIELSLMLPDKYKRVDINVVADGAAEVKRIAGFNGTEDFRDSQSTGGGMVVVRHGADNPQAQAAQARGLRREFARLVLGWLLADTPGLPLEFSYAGDAETKDGKADAIDVKGAEGFALRLFLDKQTHRPTLVSYRAPQPRAGMVMRTMQASPEEAAARQKEIQEQAQRQLTNPEMADVELYFSDYREVDGVMLPHRITRAVNGSFSEEWEIKKFKVNPPLKATDFKK